MAEKENSRVYLLFNEVPEGTHYKKDHYSWVPEDKAREYIDEGYAEPVAKEEPFTLAEPEEEMVDVKTSTTDEEE